MPLTGGCREAAKEKEGGEMPRFGAQKRCFWHDLAHAKGFLGLAKG
jgi:hypothetical protein